MLHLEDCLPHFRFSERADEDVVFLRGYLWNIQVLVFPKGDIEILRLAKEFFIISRNMTFEMIITDHNTLIIFKFIDMLLAMFPVGN